MGIKYNTFLKSEWWKFLREKRLKRKSNCDACGNDSKLQIHHYNYEFKYAGRATKAIKHTKVLCSSCHQEFHRLYGVKKDMSKEMGEFLKSIHKQKHKAKEQWQEYYEMTNWIKSI